MPGSLVLDTEYNTKPFRLISTGFVKLDRTGNSPTHKMTCLVKPQGFAIDERSPAFAVHRITHAQAVAQGVSMHSLMRWLCRVRPTCSQLVGHNVARDVKLLREEARRHGAGDVDKMLARLRTVDTLPMARAAGLQKPHTLSSVYCQLFDTQCMPEAHDAMADAWHTARVFVRLLREHQGGQAPISTFFAPHICTTGTSHA